MAQSEARPVVLLLETSTEGKLLADMKALQVLTLAQVPRYIDVESGRVHDTNRSRTVRTCRIISRILSTVIASLVPALAILALNSVADTNNRIYMTIAFTAMFGGCLATFTNASMKEIFTATATFAAVEVVFIGSAITNGPSGG